MKKAGLLVCIITFFIPFFSVHADYVLPYPSFMPGNKMYRISRFIDASKQWWHWGSIASIKYHLGLADKYLVEAKTLFEYKQFLLGLDALKRSDVQVQKILPFMGRAQKEGKSMSEFKKTIHDAMGEHQQVLSNIQRIVPETFFWQPEKQPGTNLLLHKRLMESHSLRLKVQQSL